MRIQEGVAASIPASPSPGGCLEGHVVGKCTTSKSVWHMKVEQRVALGRLGNSVDLDLEWRKSYLVT